MVAKFTGAHDGGELSWISWAYKPIYRLRSYVKENIKPRSLLAYNIIKYGSIVLVLVLLYQAFSLLGIPRHHAFRGPFERCTVLMGRKLRFWRERWSVWHLCGGEASGVRAMAGLQSGVGRLKSHGRAAVPARRHRRHASHRLRAAGGRARSRRSVPPPQARWRILLRCA